MTQLISSALRRGTTGKERAQLEAVAQGEAGQHSRDPNRATELDPRHSPLTAPAAKAKIARCLKGNKERCQLI